VPRCVRRARARGVARPNAVYVCVCVSQDYHWWWRAFLTSGCSALYMLLYGIIYYYTRSDFADTVSTVLYFGWTAVMALLMFVVTGACPPPPLRRPRSLTWCALCVCVCVYVCARLCACMWPQALWASWLACGSCARFTRSSRSTKPSRTRAPSVSSGGGGGGYCSSPAPSPRICNHASDWLPRVGPPVHGETVDRPTPVRLPLPRYGRRRHHRP
jgi:hypothetical protein